MPSARHQALDRVQLRAGLLSLHVEMLPMSWNDLTVFSHLSFPLTTLWSCWSLPGLHVLFFSLTKGNWKRVDTFSLFFIGLWRSEMMYNCSELWAVSRLPPSLNVFIPCLWPSPQTHLIFWTHLLLTSAEFLPALSLPLLILCPSLLSFSLEGFSCLPVWLSHDL